MSDSEEIITDVMDKKWTFPLTNTQEYEELTRYTQVCEIHKQIKLYYFNEPTGKTPRRIVIATVQQGKDVLYGAAIFKRCNKSEKFDKPRLRTTAVKRLCLNPGHIRDMSLEYPKINFSYENKTLDDKVKKLIKEHNDKIKRCLRQKLHTSGVRGNHRTKLIEV